MSRQIHESEPDKVQEVTPITLGEAERQIVEIIAGGRDFYNHDRRYEARIKIGKIVGRYVSQLRLPKSEDMIKVHTERTGSDGYGYYYDTFYYYPKNNRLDVHHSSPSAFCMGVGHLDVETNRPDDWINYGGRIPGKLAEVAEKTAVS